MIQDMKLTAFKINKMTIKIIGDPVMLVMDPSNKRLWGINVYKMQAKFI